MNGNSSGGKRFDSYEKKNMEYQNLLRKIGRIKAMIAADTLDELLDSNKEGMYTKAKRERGKLLRSNFLRSGAHGRHVTKHDHEMEEKLYGKI